MEGLRKCQHDNVVATIALETRIAILVTTPLTPLIVNPLDLRPPNLHPPPLATTEGLYATIVGSVGRVPHQQWLSTPRF